MQPEAEPHNSGRRYGRVGLDLHCFDGPPQGIRSHVLGLFPEVISRCPEIEFVLFADDLDGLGKLDPAWSLPNVRGVRMAYRGSVTRLLWQLPRLARRHSLDLLHVQYVAPPRSCVPSIVTLHDVLFESHPELFPKLFCLRSRILMRRAARKAQHVVTVSEYSKAEIQNRWGLEASRISVVHNAVDRTRFFPGTEGIESVRARGLTPKQYILNVGRLEKRKNLDVLVRAHASLGADAPVLVLVGNPGLGFKEVMLELAPHLHSGRVRLLQDVGDWELPALYRHAQIFTYPSQAEGFGMPLLEAMASGVPVITSATTALPEVVGRAAILLDPRDEVGLGRALQGLVQRSAERERFAAAGLERARQFAWQAGAIKLAATYRRCLGLAQEERPRDAVASGDQAA